MSAPAPAAGDGAKFGPHTGLLNPDNEKLRQLAEHHESGGLQFAPYKKGGGCPFLAMQTGLHYNDDDNTLKAGTRGPGLIEDQVMREKINHFDHEPIPERVVHARGAGVHGFFQVYASGAELLAPVTCAKIFQDPSEKTPTFVRFSTVLGSRGSPDCVRDVRGFATKFYTKDGNWDLVGNNIPVFFIQDAMKFPDVIHAGKPEPQLEIPQAQTAHDNFWDFLSWSPETVHMMMWTMSDRAIPRSYRMMQGFGVHSFVFVNAEGKRTFFKAHWRPLLGVHGLAWDECLKLNGADPDFHRRDLYENIAAGNFPEYEFGVQLVAEEDEHKFDFDILDSTKIIPEDLVPIQWVGKMTLNRLPTEFFAETEQVAFCTQNIVPGIDFSNDPLLQGRNFSYADTQLTRLGGPNFNQIPINQPLYKPQHNQRGGFMQMGIATQKLNYFPNRLSAVGEAPRPGNGGETQGLSGPYKADAFKSSMARIEGMKERVKAPKFMERYKQARLFYNSMTDVEKAHMLDAFSFELSRVDDVGVRERIVAMVNEVDHGLACGIASNIAVPEPPAPKEANDGRMSKFLSMVASPYSPPITCATRKVAVLLADGYRAEELVSVKKALEKEGALLVPVGVRKGFIYADGEAIVPASKQKPVDPTKAIPDPTGKSVVAPFTLANCKSVIFDALVLIGGPANVATLQANGNALAFICEQLRHCKAVAAASEAVRLLQFPCGLAGLEVSAPGGSSKVTVDDGVVSLSAPGGATQSEFTDAFINELKKHRAWARKNVNRIPA